MSEYIILVQRQGGVVQATAPQGPAGAGLSGSSEEIPAGAIDGINKTFTVAHVPNLKIFALMLNGLDLYPPDDFTISNAVITFVQAPVLGDKIQATYTY